MVEEEVTLGSILAIARARILIPTNSDAYNRVTCGFTTPLDVPHLSTIKEGMFR